jgi:serine/threonine protein kinase
VTVANNDQGQRATQLRPTEPLQPDDPRRIGVFELLGVLGQGGMGRVYLGRSNAGRLVAVKVVLGNLAQDEEYRRRFRSEVELAKRVPPSCTAEVLDAEPDHDPPYVAFEFIDGPSLDEVVRRDGPLAAENLHGVATGVAAALAAIHDAGVIHRDLKPSNILMAQGIPKVIDFGIARPTLDPKQLTSAASVIGTLPYMAPERLTSSDPGAITSAVDIFAWGAVVAFAGRGRDAFASESTADVIGSILNGTPDLTGLNEPLLGLVRRALIKDPQQRPTAHDLLDALTGWTSRIKPRAGTPWLATPGGSR